MLILAFWPPVSYEKAKGAEGAKTTGTDSLDCTFGRGIETAIFMVGF
jgi:hypothetical protein